MKKMKKKFYTWEECMQLREVQVRNDAAAPPLARAMSPMLTAPPPRARTLAHSRNPPIPCHRLQSLKKLNHPQIVKLKGPPGTQDKGFGAPLNIFLFQELQRLIPHP